MQLLRVNDDNQSQRELNFKFAFIQGEIQITEAATSF